MTSSAQSGEGGYSPVIHHEIWRDTLDFATRLPELVAGGRPGQLLQILTANQEGIETYRIVRGASGPNRLSYVGGYMPLAKTPWSDPSRRHHMRDSCDGDGPDADVGPKT
jgi:hypothetical protein